MIMLTHLVEAMKEAYCWTREHLRRIAEWAKHYYDARAYEVHVNVCDCVWVFCPRCMKGTSPKWSRLYSGPFEGLRKINNANYVVRRSQRWAPRIVHVESSKYSTIQVCSKICTWRHGTQTGRTVNKLIGHSWRNRWRCCECVTVYSV